MSTSGPTTTTASPDQTWSLNRSLSPSRPDTRWATHTVRVENSNLNSNSVDYSHLPLLPGFPDVRSRTDDTVSPETPLVTTEACVSGNEVPRY